MAWLHAVPEGSKKSRLSVFKANTEDGESSFLQFPDLDGAEYMITLFHEVGPMFSSGMGVIPLPWQEIESWLRTTERELAVWEKLMIREMSEVYVNEFNQASAKDWAAPYVPAIEPEDIDRKAVSDKIGSVLRGFKRQSVQP